MFDYLRRRSVNNFCHFFNVDYPVCSKFGLMVDVMPCLRYGRMQPSVELDECNGNAMANEYWVVNMTLTLAVCNEVRKMRNILLNGVDRLNLYILTILKNN